MLNSNHLRLWQSTGMRRRLLEEQCSCRGLAIGSQATSSPFPPPQASSYSQTIHYSDYTAATLLRRILSSPSGSDDDRNHLHRSACSTYKAKPPSLLASAQSPPRPPSPHAIHGTSSASGLANSIAKRSVAKRSYPTSLRSCIADSLA